MPRIKDSEFKTFSDGRLDICEAKERKILRTKEHGIRFGRRTVGVSRFWQAKVASSTIDAVVAIPLRGGITTTDICIIGDKQFKIKQVQDKFDEYPPCTLLSLEREPITYKDERSGNEGKD